MLIGTQGSMYKCQYSSIFSTYPPYHSQEQKQNSEIFSTEINIAYRGYIKQTGHVLPTADKRLNWWVWTVTTGAVPVAGTGLR